jgi:hypothetical protein
MTGGWRSALPVRLVAGAVRTVLVDPVRGGTLALRRHGSGVAGIVAAVAVVYGLVLVAIIAAGPLRERSDLIADTSRGEVTVLPAFLPPALLLLVGLSFALVLAGSQRGHPVVRALLLVALGSVVAAIVVASPGRETSPVLWWGALAALAVAVGYSVATWWLRTSPLVDLLVLLVALETALVLAYAGTVSTAQATGLRFDVVTVGLLVTYLTLLASPVAFASGVSAVGVGIAAVAWSTQFVRRQARPATVIVLLVLVSVWQAWVVTERWRPAPDRAAVQAATAAVLVAAAAAAWWAARRPTSREAEEVVERGSRLGLPVGYGLQSAALVTALLGLVAIAWSVVAPDDTRPLLTRLLDVASSDLTGTVVRWIVVGALVIAGLVARRRGQDLVAGVSWVSAVVLVAVILTLPDGPLAAYPWSPQAVGDVGLLVALGLAVAWTVGRSWTHDRTGYLLVVVGLAALVRQANVLETPMAFLIGGSAVGLLVFGLAWSFVTGGGGAHDDSRWLPGDRRILVFVGEALYALAITAWAVIGRQADAVATLTSFATLAVLTLGTALVLASAFALAPRLAAAPAVEAPVSTVPA